MYPCSSTHATLHVDARKITSDAGRIAIAYIKLHKFVKFYKTSGHINQNFVENLKGVFYLYMNFILTILVCFSNDNKLSTASESFPSWQFKIQQKKMMSYMLIHLSLKSLGGKEGLEEFQSNTIKGMLYRS